jgi:16S rRNA U516 pseudouridylate synthase RsuA-like enzyme
MGKRKRKLTAAEKAEKKRRRELYEFIFVGGRMKRVRRRPMIDGMDADELIRRNADPIWLHQNEEWEYIQAEDAEFLDDDAHPEDRSSRDDDLPF